MTAYLQKNFYLDLRSLALFRVGLGLITLYNLYNLFPDIDAFFGPGGICPLSDPGIKRHLCWSFLSLGDSRYFILGLFVLHAAFACLLVLGLCTPFAAFACWIMWLSLFHRAPVINFGGDRALIVFLMWGMFLPLGAKFSLDALLKTKKDHLPNQFCSAASVALICQLVFLYMCTGFQKTDIAWERDYTALYYVMNWHMDIKPWASSWLAFPNLLMGLTYLTLILERYAVGLLFLPFSVTFYRTALIIVFLIFHVLIDMTIEIGWFSWVMMAVWIALIPSAWWGKAALAKSPGEAKYDHRHNVLYVLLAAVLILTFPYLRMLKVATPDLPAVFRWGEGMLLCQRWKMFAPAPPYDSREYYFQPVLAPGPRSAPGPIYPLRSPTFRWSKVYFNFSRTNMRKFHLVRHFKEYILMAWNKEHPDRPATGMRLKAALSRVDPFRHQLQNRRWYEF